MGDEKAFYSLAKDGILVMIRLTPQSSASRIIGTAPDADGRAVLKVALMAVPENGKANEALIDLLARAWRLPRRDISIVQGMTSRRKTVRVSGDPPMLRERIESAMNEGRV